MKLYATPQRIRALVRAVTVCATGFGLKLSPEMVAGVQLVVEAALQMLSPAPKTAEADA